MCLQGYLYRLRKSILQIWRFGSKGGLEEQKSIGEKDVVTVPRGDRDFVATPWEIARSSGGGTDIVYRNAVPIPNQYQRTVETTAPTTTTSTEAYTSYSDRHCEGLDYSENDGDLEANLECDLYDDNDMVDPDEDPINSLYYQWDVADFDSDSYNDNYSLDGTYTDDDYYESDFTDLDMAYTDDDYCNDDYSGLDIAYADDLYYDGFYNDIDVADPDDDLDELDFGADPDHDPDSDDYPDIADPDIADDDDDE